MERNELNIYDPVLPAIVGLLIMIVVVSGWQYLNPTAMFVGTEDVVYVTADSNCWTCNANIVQPRVTPQNKKLVIIDTNT